MLEKMSEYDSFEYLADDAEEANGSIAVNVRFIFSRFWYWVNFCHFPCAGEVADLKVGFEYVV